MSLVVYAEESGATTPGHMVVGEEPGASTPNFFGYRFDPADVPEKYRSVAGYREYLFTNTVPGNIVDETGYVQQLLGRGRTYYRKIGACTVLVVTVIPPESQWRRYANYSFNPGDFHAAESPCYNCVSWATEIANQLVGGFLVPVRHGRVKLIIEQLEAVLGTEE